MTDEASLRDYDSLNGFQTRGWGPALWHVLYMVAANYPPHPSGDDKNRLVNFIRSVWQNLPCGICRDNFTKNVRQGSPAEITPEIFESRNTMFQWVWNLHSAVNKALDKGPLPFTVEEAREFVETFRASKCMKKPGKSEGGCDESVHPLLPKLCCTLHFTPSKPVNGVVVNTDE